MAFCGKCGARIEDGARFCPSCGAEIPVFEKSTQRTSGSEQNDFASKVQNLNNTADTTTAFDAQDIQNNKAMAILAYLSILVLIPLFAAKESKFARFHTNQGLILAIAEIIFSIAYSIISSILYAISWRLGFIATIISICSIVFLILAIIGIVNAADGKAKELPIIGKYKIIQ
ncbi:MAG: zinc-ribbon domain-containing protein [Clostridiales bacterium]|nr:zinc-ribbon domain-containing protein [Clostridiales bacterium]